MLLSFRRKKHNQVRDLSVEESGSSHGGVGLSPLAKSLCLSTSAERRSGDSSPATIARGSRGGYGIASSTTLSPPSAHVSTSLYSCCSLAASIPDSLGSMSSGDVFDEAKQMRSLKHDVERFSQAVNHLRTALSAQTSCGYEERGIDTGPQEGTKTSAKSNDAEKIGDRIHWLGQVKNIVIGVLNSHRTVHSTGIVSSLGALMSKLIDDGEAEETSDKLLDSLENAFCASISEYMQTEGNESSRFLSVPGMSRESSMESLLSESKEHLAETPFSPARGPKSTVGPALSVNPHETAQKLIKMDTGMDIMFEHAKVWSRFLKDLVSYYEKKAQYKLDFATRTIKLTRSMRDIVTELDGLGLPFFSSITLGLEHDLALYRKWHDAYKSQLAARVLEPLAQHRESHEKQRKLLKEAWLRHQKKLSEAVGILKKARAKYVQLSDECTKVATKLAVLEREEASLSKLEKRSKQEEDLKVKTKEAESAYRVAVEEANHMLESLETFKAKKLIQMCQAFHGNEQFLRKLLLEYVEIERDASRDVDSSRDELISDYFHYTIGSQFLALVYSYYDDENDVSNFSRFEFTPHPKPNLKKSRSAEDLIGSEGDYLPRSNTDFNRAPFLSPARKMGSGIKTSIVAKFNKNKTTGGGSREEGSGNEGGKKGNSLPDSRSPPVLRHPLPVRKRPSSIAGQSLEEMRANGDKSPSYARNLKTGAAYMLRMMKEPFRGGGGKDHEVAGALPPETTTGDKSRLSRRPTFFGVDLARQCRMTGRPIPLLVEKCVAELDRRALATHGLYRVSAAQTRCKELCRAFELKAEDVDLSDLPPHLIASVLKYYLRQLPQPLLTYRLYSSFINVAKKWQSTQLNALRNAQQDPPSTTSSQLNKTRRSVSLDQSPVLHSHSSSQEEVATSSGGSVPRSSSQFSLATSEGSGDRKKSIVDGETDEVLEDLRAVVEQLPNAFYLTASRVFYHLNRVASYEAENSMSASNLAIVFGPNILKPRDNETTTFSTLIDMQHQLRAVELLIRFPGVLDVRPSTKNEESKEKSEERVQEESSEEEVDPISPPPGREEEGDGEQRRRSHSHGEILISPPSGPSTPPMRKRQSITELEDLYAALTNSNKDRLHSQRSRLSDDFTEEDEKHVGGGGTTSDGSYECLLPGTVQQEEVRFTSKSPGGGSATGSPARSLEGLVTPARLSPLGPSLYEHFDLEIRKAVVEDEDEDEEEEETDGKGVGGALAMLMQEAAKTAASTNSAAKHLSLPRGIGNGSGVEKKFENEILAEINNDEDDEDEEDSYGSDDDEAIIDLLIRTDHAVSPPPSADVVAQELSLHTSTLVEHVGDDETSEMTVRQRSPSPLKMTSVIEGLMKEFNREISALNTPPESPNNSPRLVGRRKVVRRPKGGKVKTQAESLDSLLSTSPPNPAIKVSSAAAAAAAGDEGSQVEAEEEKGHRIHVETGWRKSVEVTTDFDVEQRDSGISLMAAGGVRGAPASSSSFDTDLAAAGSKKKGREPRFV